MKIKRSDNFSIHESKEHIRTSPTSGPFSKTQTERSEFLSRHICFNRMAADKPAGPAPTMTTSYSSTSRSTELLAKPLAPPITRRATRDPHRERIGGSDLVRRKRSTEENGRSMAIRERELGAVDVREEAGTVRREWAGRERRVETERDLEVKAERRVRYIAETRKRSPAPEALFRFDVLY